MHVIFITDPRASLERVVHVIEVAARVLPPEGLIVQLRDRSSSPLHEVARHLRDVTTRTRSLFMVNAINDDARFDLARSVAADGVHIACTVQAIERARAANFKLTSVPAHTDDEVRTATNAGASAALVSPIFETPGKGAARGVEAIHRACATAAGTTRIYALGGIDASRAAACAQAGAFGVAVIRALLDADDPADVARRLDAPFH